MNENGNNGCFIKGGVPWNKGTTKETNTQLRKPTKYIEYSSPYERECPKCGVLLTYSTVYVLISAIDNNRKCNKCANEGKGWQSSSTTYERTDVINKKSSEARMGVVVSEEARKNMSIAKQNMSEETKQKMSIAKQNMSEETRKKMRLSAIQRISDAKYSGNQVMPSYNITSISILEQKAKELNIVDLQHAENGGEYFINELGYWVDGYSKDKNIVIEYYEKFHNKKIKRDLRRQKEIIKFLNCEFIIIKE